MAYESGDIIQTADYNSIVAQINELFGVGDGDKGYGGNSLNVPIVGDISTIAGTGLVDNEAWLIILRAQEDMRDHQGTALPEPLPLETDIENGDIIFALDDQTPDNPEGEINSAANLLALTTNRLTVNPTNITNTNKLASSRSSAWVETINHEFTVTFDDEDHARYFFNTGGQILISASRSGGTAKPQNTDWTTLLNNNSPYVFGATEYYTLSTSPTLYASFTGTGDFATNHWDIYASTNGISTGPNNGHGYILTFSSEFIDEYFGVNDFVDGLIISTISENRSSGIFNISSPTYASTVLLTATPPVTHFSHTFDLTANTYNYNIHDELILVGWNGVMPVNAIVNIDPGVVIGSTSTAIPSFDTGSIPATSTIIINNEGKIEGKGGKGGKGGNTFSNGSPGLPGGTALNITFDVTLDNSVGEIWGGGGGGGGGAGISQNSNHGPEGGGGGAGVDGGGGGGGGPARNHHSNCNNGCAGKPGTEFAGGTTGNCHPSGSGCGSVPRGGTGGGPGSAGSSGSNFGGYSGGAGGAAGNSIVTNGNTLTFSGLVGDIQGPQI